MDRNMKKAILKNRVKLLSLDYFDLTGPLLASEIFPSKKHKEIKGNASDSKARVDLLLDWLEDHAPKDAFPLFLQGIRNCHELILAKRIKREAGGEAGASASGGGKAKSATPKQPKPKPNTASKVDLDKFLAGIIPTLSIPSAPSTKPAASTSTADKPKKPKKPKAPTATGGPVPLNGLPSFSLPPPPVPVAKKRKADGEPKIKLPKVIGGAPKTPKSAAAGGKAKTPNKQNGANQPGSRGSTPKGGPSAAATAAAAAAAAAAAIMSTTPRTTRKSSSSDIVQIKGKGAGKGAKKPKTDKPTKATPAASSTSPRSKGGKLTSTPMTFKEVEDKQQDFKNKFKFTNNNAVTKTVIFKDKSDITYLGCPFMANNKMCGKKVELKSKEFICEAKHKSPNCRQIPRLQIACSDGTAELILTLMKQNVEIFTGKTETEIETMSVDDIKVVLEKTTGKKLKIEVASEKAKKQGTVKKGAPVRWNNVATILTDNDDGPPSKKKRKN